MILHTLNKPPANLDVFQRCCAAMGADDTLVLLEDGAYSAIVGTSVSTLIADLANKGKVYLVADDFLGRGLPTNRLLVGVQLIGYEEFVALICEHDKQVAWF